MNKRAQLLQSIPKPRKGAATLSKWQIEVTGLLVASHVTVTFQAWHSGISVRSQHKFCPGFYLCLLKTEMRKVTWRHGAAEEEKGKFALIPLGPSGIIIKTLVSTTLTIL